MLVGYFDFCFAIVNWINLYSFLILFDLSQLHHLKMPSALVLLSSLSSAPKKLRTILPAKTAVEQASPAISAHCP